MSGVGHLNFSIDSDTGLTPQPAGNNKEAAIPQQPPQLPVTSLLGNVSNNGAVTITPSTPLMFTPSPATNQQLSSNPTQKRWGDATSSSSLVD